MLNLENEYQVINYSEKISNDDDRISVGKTNFTEDINLFFEEIKKTLRPTEFTENILNRLKGFYRPGDSFKNAFKQVLYSLFDKYGLLVFDPQDMKIKEILIPIFKKEISDFRTHTEQVIKVSATLEELYQAQIKVKPVNLFYSDNNGRFLIEPTDEGFRLKGKHVKFTLDELLNLIDTQPQNFSPNVLLRPICQDYILPTAFYVGGPSEIAYFAQLLPMYNIFNIEEPIIFPRSSATLIEKGIQKSIDKFKLNLEDVFVEKKQLEKKYGLRFQGDEILLLQHSVTTQSEQSKKQIIETLSAISKLKKPTIVIVPNSDAGNLAIYKNLKKYSEKYNFNFVVERVPCLLEHIDPVQQERPVLFRVERVMPHHNRAGIPVELSLGIWFQ